MPETSSETLIKAKLERSEYQLTPSDIEGRVKQIDDLYRKLDEAFPMTHKERGHDDVDVHYSVEDIIRRKLTYQGLGGKFEYNETLVAAFEQLIQLYQFELDRRLSKGQYAETLRNDVFNFIKVKNAIAVAIGKK